MQRRIVLPFAAAKFRAESVIDRPGDWGDLYDGMIAEATASGNLVVLKNGAKQADPFSATNQRLIEEAFAVSGETPGVRVRKSKLRAVVVWEGRSRGPGDYTQEFADMAKAQGIPVEVVLTSK